MIDKSEIDAKADELGVRGWTLTSCSEMSAFEKLSKSRKAGQ